MDNKVHNTFLGNDWKEEVRGMIVEEQRSQEDRILERLLEDQKETLITSKVMKEAIAKALSEEKVVGKLSDRIVRRLKK